MSPSSQSNRRWSVVEKNLLHKLYQFSQSRYNYMLGIHGNTRPPPPLRLYTAEYMAMEMNSVSNSMTKRKFSRTVIRDQIRAERDFYQISDLKEAYERYPPHGFRAPTDRVHVQSGISHVQDDQIYIQSEEASRVENNGEAQPTTNDSAIHESVSQNTLVPSTIRTGHGIGFENGLDNLSQGLQYGPVHFENNTTTQAQTENNHAYSYNSQNNSLPAIVTGNYHMDIGNRLGDFDQGLSQIPSGESQDKMNTLLQTDINYMDNNHSLDALAIYTGNFDQSITFGNGLSNLAQDLLQHTSNPGNFNQNPPQSTSGPDVNSVDSFSTSAVCDTVMTQNSPALWTPATTNSPANLGFDGVPYGLQSPEQQDASQPATATQRDNQSDSSSDDTASAKNTANYNFIMNTVFDFSIGPLP